MWMYVDGDRWCVIRLMLSVEHWLWGRLCFKRSLNSKQCWRRSACAGVHLHPASASVTLRLLKEKRDWNQHSCLVSGWLMVQESHKLNKELRLEVWPQSKTLSDPRCYEETIWWGKLTNTKQSISYIIRLFSILACKHFFWSYRF